MESLIPAALFINREYFVSKNLNKSFSNFVMAPCIPLYLDAFFLIHLSTSLTTEFSNLFRFCTYLYVFEI